MRSQRVMLFINILLAALFAAFSIIAVCTAEKPEEKTYTPREIDNEWAYFLINKDNPLPDGYSPELSAVEGKYMLDSRCAEYAVQMLEDAKAEGLDLMVVSAYRSPQKQKENYSAYIARSDASIFPCAIRKPPNTSVTRYIIPWKNAFPLIKLPIHL